ncbi:MAG: peptidoglycan DD-metalloendopeptidase family protein [Chloroflexota bacterium]|nr:peptidoglycan DD-metalloendopeptidase family protein [Chloroflexota bacterium]
MSWSRLFVLLFVVILAVPVIAPPAVEAASLKDQIAAAKERQAALTKSIAKSQRLVSQLKSDEAKTKRDLDATKEDLKDIRADQQAVKARIEKVGERLKRIEAHHADLVDEQRQTDFTLGLLEQELANGEVDLKTRRQALALRLAEAHRTENTTLLDQLFTAESFSDVLSDTSAYLSIADQDAQLAQQIMQDQQALDSLRLLTTSTRLRTDQLRRDTLDTQERVEELRGQLREAKQRLGVLERATEKARDRQKAAIARIAKNKKEAQAIVQKQQSARNTLMRSIRNKVASMQAKASAQFGGVAPTGGSGRFDWPTRGSITQGYGCTGYYINPPKGSCAHFHDGIDIANSSGTPIYAAASGVVAFIGWNPYEYNPAFIVVIAHGGGISTLYAHMLATYPVSVGQTVKKGKRIGSMGNTGGSFGSHLHFEVWAGGDWQPVNPYAYLP